mmetsp:Transcript_6516/g.7077  ORF Transcript_6516/g.7077 Transcript_6516/m.7077 type:complete len:446 (-) Transcript_6516:204-1541(-)
MERGHLPSLDYSLGNEQIMSMPPPTIPTVTNSGNKTPKPIKGSSAVEKRNLALLKDVLKNAPPDVHIYVTPGQVRNGIKAAKYDKSSRQTAPAVTLGTSVQAVFFYIKSASDARMIRIRDDGHKGRITIVPDRSIQTQAGWLGTQYGGCYLKYIRKVDSPNYRKSIVIDFPFPDKQAHVPLSPEYARDDGSTHDYHNKQHGSVSFKTPSPKGSKNAISRKAPIKKQWAHFIQKNLQGKCLTAHVNVYFLSSTKDTKQHWRKCFTKEDEDALDKRVSELFVDPDRFLKNDGWNLWNRVDEPSGYTYNVRIIQPQNFDSFMWEHNGMCFSIEVNMSAVEGIEFAGIPVGISGIQMAEFIATAYGIERDVVGGQRMTNANGTPSDRIVVGLKRKQACFKQSGTLDLSNELQMTEPVYIRYSVQDRKKRRRVDTDVKPIVAEVKKQDNA